MERRRGSCRDLIGIAVIDYLRININTILIIFFRINYMQRKKLDPFLLTKFIWQISEESINTAVFCSSIFTPFP